MKQEATNTFGDGMIMDLNPLTTPNNVLTSALNATMITYNGNEFVLQNEGADVTKAWDGQEAVELFRNSEPGEFDVILMDIMMPVMNGYEATKMIRSLDREDAKTIPIIAMTANAFTEDRLKAKEAGMNEHIVKPLDVELLIKVIHKLVEY